MHPIIRSPPQYINRDPARNRHISHRILSSLLHLLQYFRKFAEMSTARNTEGPKFRLLLILCLYSMGISVVTSTTPPQENSFPSPTGDVPPLSQSFGPDLNTMLDENTTSALPSGYQAKENAKHLWMKRKFARGQPELQQALDSMLLHEEMIKRNLQFPPPYLEGYPALLTQKTGSLLSEAEHMLNRVKNLRERRWVENFVHRLKLLASTLDGIAVPPSFQFRVMNMTRRGTMQTLRTSRTPKNDPLLIPTSTSPATDHSEDESTAETPATVSKLSRVILPQSIKSQRSFRASRAKTGPRLIPTSTSPAPHHSEDESTTETPATASKLSRVILLNPVDGQTSTRPGLIQQLRNKKYDEDDELVRELENLHKVAALENQPSNTTPAVAIPKSASPATFDPSNYRMSTMAKTDPTIEDKKKELKEAIVQEVAALQRLGETPEEIMNTLRFDAETLLGFKEPQSIFDKNTNTEKEVHSFEAENTLKGLNTEVKDVHSEESMVNRHVWRPSTQVHPASHPSKDMYINKSLPGMHVNLPSMNEQILLRQLQIRLPKNQWQLPHATVHVPHHNGIKNAIQKLQGQDYQFSNQDVHNQQTFPIVQHGISAPLGTKQNNFLQHGGKNNFNPPFGLYRFGSGNGYNHNPYPYFPSINHKNSTMYGTQILPGHNIDNNFSDEMKRQLRDGKVILLSDSVVRSNFEETSEKDTDENGKIGLNNKSEGKNETQAQN